MTASGSTTAASWTQTPRFDPTSADDARDLIRGFGSSRTTVRFVGGGSTLRAVSPSPTDVTVGSAGLTGIFAYEPDDLTVVVRAGTAVEDLEDALRTHRQTALLPPVSGRTVGGVIAAGDSGFARLRYGPTRDRVLGVTLVTGYGRIVSGGGPLVKNVTGYDLPRLCVGSEGALGFIVDVSLKLWPLPSATRTIPIGAATDAAVLYRPTAVIETENGVAAYVGGSEAEVVRSAQLLGSPGEEGWTWPAAPRGPHAIAVLVPPSETAAAIATLDGAGVHQFVAQHGVGRIDASAEVLDGAAVDELRREMAALRGRVVITRWPGDLDRPDRWGFTPNSAGITARLRAAFDPFEICNPGRLAEGSTP